MLALTLEQHKQTVIDALVFMVSNDPDKCSELNGIGFNAFDSDIGHSIYQAYQDKGYLTNKQYATICKILTKYKKQHGIILPSQDVFDVPDEHKLYSKEKKAERKIVYDFDTMTLKLFAPYEGEKVNDFLKKSGWKAVYNDGKFQYWECHYNTKLNGTEFGPIDVYYTRYPDTGFQCPVWIEPVKMTTEQVLSCFPKDELNVTKTGKLVLNYKVETARVWAGYMFDEFDAGEFRQYLLKTGWEYTKNVGYTRNFNRSFLRYFEKMAFSKFVKVSNEVLEGVSHLGSFEKSRKSLLKPALESIAYFANNGIAGEHKLFQHQKEFLTSLKTNGAILAFDMGLGKTLTSLYWAYGWYQATNCNVYIIVPKSVKQNWHNAIHSEAFRFMPVTLVSWAKIPEPKAERYIIIADESHYSQDPDSSRSKSFVEFTQGALGTLCLSGTPSKNGTVRDLYCQLHAVDFCTDKEQLAKAYGWKDDISMRKLGTELREQGLITYRHKSEALDLPPKLRQEHYVSLSKEYEDLYYQRYNEFMASYGERVLAGLVSGNMEQLVAIQGLRLAASLGKVQGTFELITELILAGQQVAVFCDFREAIDKLSKLLDKYGITYHNLESSDSSQKRLEKQQDFQNGNKQVFLTSYKCGGVGIELTPCTNVVLLDRPWTPGDAVQAEDRCHRIGQSGTVNAYWVYWPDPDKIEKRVDDKIHLKQDNINDLTGFVVSLDTEN